MIVLNMKMDVVPEKKLEVTQTVLSMVSEIRRSKGCIKCCFYEDVENECRFTLIEEWNSQKDIDVYLRSEHFKLLIGSMSHLLVRPAEHSTSTVSRREALDIIITKQQMEFT